MSFLFRFCVANDTEDREKLKTENEKLTETITEMDGKLSTLQLSHCELQQETDKTKRDNDKLKESLQEYKDNYETVQSQLNQYEIWLNKSNLKKKELQNMIDAMQREKDKIDKSENENETNIDMSDSKEFEKTLNDAQKREQSLTLLTCDNNGLITFIKKMIDLNNTQNIWSKCDAHNSDRKIEYKNIHKYMKLLVIFYKLSKNKQQSNRDNNNKQSKIDKQQIAQSTQHLTAWIILKYGNEKTYVDFRESLVSYLQAYADAKGM